MPITSDSGFGGTETTDGSITTNLPTGSEQLDLPQIVYSTGGFGAFAQAFDSAGDTLPEGSKDFYLPPTVSNSGGFGGKTVTGKGATGRVTRDGSFVSGVVTVVSDGYLIAKKPLTSIFYTLSGAPPSITAGKSIDGSGDSYVKFQAEDGSVASKDLTGTLTEFYINLSAITVGVSDVDGDPVLGDKVILAKEELQTESDGEVSVGSSGTVEITALQGTSERTIAINPDSPTRTDFQYSGIHGKVRGSEGITISGTTVYLVDDETGALLASDTTDIEGKYNFDEVPLNRDVTIKAGPFERSATSRGEGEDLLKMVPFEVEDVGTTKVEVVDAKSGDPVVNLDVLIEEAGFGAVTGENGEAAVIAQPEGGEQEMSVTLGEEDPRYASASLNPVVVAGETVAYEVELERATAITEV